MEKSLRIEPADQLTEEEKLWFLLTTAEVLDYLCLPDIPHIKAAYARYGKEFEPPKGITAAELNAVRNAGRWLAIERQIERGEVRPEDIALLRFIKSEEKGQSLS